MTLEGGTKLGSYEILAPLGEGGMGEVYKARDERLDRDVAIKILPPEMASDTQRLQRFEQEARAASALNHPNIVTIHEIGEHEGTPFIAMEYVEGKTLRELLVDGALPNDELIRYATQMAEGLAKAHQAGIVHRDLKPENVMISDDGFVKILDFGLAKLMPSKVDSEMKTMERTKEGVVVGTVGYMSPEQAAGRSVDFSSDQFSFGSILYEMATGTRPFERETAAQTLVAIIEDEADPVTAVNPKVGATTARVIDRCLSKDPKERYDSTWDIAKDIHWEELATPRPTPTRHPLAAVGIVGVLAIVLVMIFGVFVPNIREWIAGDAEAPKVGSIAVLPLENLSGDPEQEYFADGMTDELIAKLAQIGALKVISRTSVMQYKGTRKPLREISAELGADAIVEGTVRRAEGRVRIAAQLIQAETDEHLWAESYDRDLQDILTLQSEVARAIAQQIEVVLTPEEAARLAESRPVDPEVYELYLKGRHHWGKSTEEGFWQSVESFNLALQKDPSFTPAYVGLAESYFTSGNWYLSPEEVGSKVRVYASKAVELDDELDEAHRMLAFIEMQDWNWAAAERELKRALELNPSSAYAHDTYSTLLGILGRFEEMVAEEEEALKINPLSHYINCNAGFKYFFADRQDEAFHQARQTTDLFGNACPFENLVVGKAYNRMGMYEDAILELETRKAQLEEQPRTIAELGYAYALAGRSDEAQQMIDELEELARRKPVDPYLMASIHVALGDKDAAFRRLEQAYERRTFFIPFLGADPELAPLRDDPRFQDLLRRMNLPRLAVAPKKSRAVRPTPYKKSGAVLLRRFPTPSEWTPTLSVTNSFQCCEKEYGSRDWDSGPYPSLSDNFTALLGETAVISS